MSQGMKFENSFSEIGSVLPLAFSDDNYDYNIKFKVFEFVNNSSGEIIVQEKNTNNIELLRLDKENKEFSLLGFSTTEN
jgi:hypothetical protein